MSQNNAILLCSFGKDSIYNMTKNLILSIRKNGDVKNVDIIIMTNEQWVDRFKLELAEVENKIIFLTNSNFSNLSTMEMTWQRFNIFNFSNIEKYKKILYLDTDILVQSSIEKIFDIKMNKLIYSYNDGYMGKKKIFDTNNEDFYGLSYLRSKNNVENFTIFSTGVMLLNSSDDKLKNYFKYLQKFYIKEIKNKYDNFYNCDQPAANIFLSINKLVEANGLNQFVLNYPQINKTSPIIHFSGGIGDDSKIETINNFIKENMLT